MRIKKLELKNFRGFEELVIDFPEGEGGLAVFVGVNGSGKTSVLDSIMDLAHIYYYNLYSTLFKKNTADFPSKILGSLLGRKDIKNKESELLNILTVNNNVKNNFLIKHNLAVDGERIRCHPPVNYILGVSSKEDLQYRFSNNDKGWKVDEQLAKRKKIHEQNFIFKYYPAEKTIQKKPSLNPKDVSGISIIETFHDAFDNKANFEDFFDWFRNTEDNEVRKIARKDKNFRDKGLESFRNALSLFLTIFNNPRVELTEHGEEFLVEKNGEKFSISQLSDGEKTIIALVGDISRRLQIANPNSDNHLHGKGVIVIDEIEQHLHPGWQRTIIPNLRRTFPNIQFIVTTHSPQVLSNVPRENVFILEDFKLVKDTPYTLGRDSNSILWDLFAVRERPEKAQKEFSKLSRLMNDPEKDEEARELLKELAEKYGENDSEVVRARLHFEFLTEG